jgi:hypothetical protein
MVDNSTLLLLLGQMLAVAAIALALLGLLLWRTRRRYRRLLSVYATLKHLVDEPAHEEGEAATPEEPAPEFDWQALEMESLARYKKFSEKSLGDYDADDPFSARIAAIRYHYAQAERQADSQQTEHERWQQLEKGLAKLVASIASSGKPLEAHEPDQVAVLRERMQALKNVEADNAELRGQNQRYGDELTSLRQYYQKYRALMADAGAPSVPEGPESQAHSKARALDEAQARQRQAAREVSEHINNGPHKEVYDTREGFTEQADELNTGAAEYDKKLAQLHQSLEKRADLDRLTAIDSLRGSNQRQRNTINNLYHELDELRSSMENEAPDKQQQTQALERMLNECESCITTLESEVNYLQQALEQRESEIEAAQAGESSSVQADFAETLLAFSLSVVEKDSASAMSCLLTDTLMQLNLPHLVAITANSEPVFTGSANIDNDTLRQQLLDIATTQLQEHNAEGLFFSRPSMQVFIPGPALADVDLQGLIRALEVMHALIVLQLEQYSSLEQLTEHHHKVTELGRKIRSGITNVDIQYAYQTEEVKRISKNLIMDVKQLLEQLEVDRPTREAFNHVISEARQRFTLLQEAGSGIENEFARLSDELDKLEQQ